MSPSKLLRIFSTVAILGFFIVLGISVLGMSYALNKYNIESAERDSISIGYTLFHMERDTLINKENNSLNPLIPEEDFEAFDSRMRVLLEPLNIIKIKIFSLDSKIAYSTDHDIIGHIDIDNAKLLNAFKGDVSPSMQTKEAFTDLSYEKRFDIDVVETYLPMYDHDHNILGAYEVYMDITPYRAKVQNTLITQVLLITALLLIILGSLGFIMLRGTSLLTESQKALENRASHDELTNIYNRRYLNQSMKDELILIKFASSSKAPSYTGVILIDIDHFKRINDEYGHLFGDEFLIAFSNKLKENLRDEDIFGRYGGEEFLIILPKSSANETSLFAKRLHTMISNSPLVVGKKECMVTASIGVSNLDSLDASPDDALGRADKALYLVKENGRNNVSELFRS